MSWETGITYLHYYAQKWQPARAYGVAQGTLLGAPWKPKQEEKPEKR